MSRSIVGRTDPPEERVLNWLLEKEQPSVRYYTLVDLLGRPDDDPEVRAARAAIPRTGWAADMLRTQNPKGYWEPNGPKNVRQWLSFLYFPEYRSTIWRALVLSDLGLTSSLPGIRKLAECIFEYKLRLSSPVNFFHEEVCAAGNTARVLTRFGYGDDRRVGMLYDWLLEDQREDGGWNCSQGTPGTLDAWEALAAFAVLPRSKRSPRINRSIERGAEFYLKRGLFREGTRYDPWFRLHYPTHYYYDILVGLDVITRLGFSDDRRLRPALKILESKRRRDGRWSIDKAHPDTGRSGSVDLHTKKVRPLILEEPGRPSKWITLTALRVRKRVEDAR
jgi:hypothetical protein